MKKYSRKDFLKAGVLLAGAGLVGACSNEHKELKANVDPAEGASDMEMPIPKSIETIHWKLATAWPAGFPVLGESCELFAKWVDEMSGGRLKIKVYGAGKLIPALEVFDKVSDGSIQLASSASYYWAGKAPASQFFASIPFGMNAQQMNAWLLRGGGQVLWEEVYAPFGVLPFVAGNTGVQMGGWFKKEINNIGDFQGLKMRIPGLGGKVIEKVGGAAVTVPASEIYTNLETGVIDATEWIGPYHDAKMGFADIADYYYSPGWHEPGSTLELLANKAAFEALPADLQQIVRTATHRMNTWVLAEFEVKNIQFLNKLRKEHPKLQLRKFSPEVLEQLKAATAEVIADLVASDPLSKKVYASFSSFQKNAKTWSTMTEKAFYNSIQ